MKVKKALKRLAKVEELLSDVVGYYSSIEQSARDLLVSARLLVVRAKESLSDQPSPSSARKPALKAEKSNLKAGGRKKASPAAKKRRGTVKRRGVSAVTDRLLSKTA